MTAENSAATTSEQRVQRIEASVQGVLRQVQRVPPEVLYQAPREGEWPVMSTLAHLAEILPYWAHQAEAVARTPGTPFGRTHDDPDRIAGVEQHAQDARDAMVTRIKTNLDDCVRTLRALPEEAWQAAGVHPRAGAMTVAQIVERFLMDHAEEHAEQLDQTLRALQPQPR